MASNVLQLALLYTIPGTAYVVVYIIISQVWDTPAIRRGRLVLVTRSHLLVGSLLIVSQHTNCEVKNLPCGP